jgi:hypothetical protein
VLCLASKRGGKIPGDDDVAFQLRVSIQDAAQQIDDLILAGLVDIEPSGARTPHNWTERQYASDSSAERVRKHRERKKKAERNVTGAVTVTAQNRTDSEKNNNYVLSSSHAREEEQGFNIDFGKGTKGRGEDRSWNAIRQRAEGFGLPVAELADLTTRKGVRNRTAYFTTLAINRLQTQLPQVSPDLLRDALWGKGSAAGVVYAALTGAAS